MEKQYVDLNEGTIKEDEKILWVGYGSRIVELISGFLISTPMLAFILVFSYEDLGNYIWIFAGVFLFAFIALGLPYLGKNKRLTEEYVMTNKKIILNKKIVKLRYWFSYDELIDIKVKRNIVDLILKRATLRLKVIHTTHRRSDLSIIGKRVGFIEMLHIKNYELVVDALNKMKVELKNKPSYYASK